VSKSRSSTRTLSCIESRNSIVGIRMRPRIQSKLDTESVVPEEQVGHFTASDKAASSVVTIARHQTVPRDISSQRNAGGIKDCVRE